MGFTVCELAARADLAAARCDPAAFDGADVADGLHQTLFYVRESAERVAMRMFAPTLGIVEDPATGSAAAALAALLAHLDPSADATVRLAITQGDEIGRPSRIAASAEKRGGVIGPVRVGGTAVAVMDGTLRL
jgi:trans-2,3-dihydro-3-hydroxyanthranilate isomerase